MLSKYQSKLASIIHKHLPGCKIYLFGLKLKEQEGKYLEVHIAIDAGSLSGLGVIGNIYSDIQKELLPIDVDMVDINDVSDQLRDKILSKGVLLHG